MMRTETMEEQTVFDEQSKLIHEHSISYIVQTKTTHYNFI